MSTPNTYWMAFHVPSQKERVAETIARQCGFSAHVPTEVKTRGRRTSKRNSKREREYPIINGYLFIRFEDEPDWLNLMRVRMIGPAVGFDGIPATISDKQMQLLLRRSGKRLPHRHSTNTRHSFVVGDTVEITQGPLINSLVKVEEIVGERARVIFKMLGVERKVDVPLRSLDAA